MAIYALEFDSRCVLLRSAEPRNRVRVQAAFPALVRQVIKSYTLKIYPQVFVDNVRRDNKSIDD